MSSAGVATPSREDLKRMAAEVIDARADELVSLSKTILANPEPGFRETKTARLVAGKFAEMGMQARVGLALTGPTGRPGGRQPRPGIGGYRRAGLTHRQRASLTPIARRARPTPAATTARWA